MQLLEIWKWVSIVILLEVGQPDIELCFSLLRGNSEDLLIFFNCLGVTMNLGIQHAKIRKRTDVSWVQFENQSKAFLCLRVFTCVQRAHGCIKGLLRSFRSRAKASVGR